MCVQDSDNDILEALKNPPRKISQLIDLKMEHSKLHASHKNAIKILQYGGVVRRPLITDEMGELLSLTIEQSSLDRSRIPTDLRRIVVACRGLVYIDEEEDTLHFIHHNVPKYLYQDKKFSPIGFVKHDVDLHLGYLCLTYLDFNDFKQELVRYNKSSVVPIDPMTFGIASIAQSSVPTARMAQKLLPYRKKLQHVSTSVLGHRTQDILRETASGSSELENKFDQFSFLVYAGMYWIYHLDRLEPNNAYMWKLFGQLVNHGSHVHHRVWMHKSDSQQRMSAKDVYDAIQWSLANDHLALQREILSRHVKLSSLEKERELLLKPLFSNQFELFTILSEHIKFEQDVLDDILLCASCTGQIDFVDALLTWRGADANRRRLRGGYSQVLNLKDMDYRNFPFQTFTREHGVSSQIAGDTALQVATKGGHLAVVDRLLTAGADVNAAPDCVHGHTALQAAAEGGYVEIADRLLTAGADVNAAPNSTYGRTALQAAAKGGYLEIVDMLLVKEADVNAPPGGVDRRIALEEAARRGHLKVVHRLMSAEADINADIRFCEQTALQAAAEGDHLKVINRLLTAGADVNALPYPQRGLTALQGAAKGGFLEAVDRLLIAGADVNATATWGRQTALQVAAKGGYIDIVNRLLVARADVDAEAGPNDGQTALRAATEEGQLEIVAVLKAAGARK